MFSELIARSMIVPSFLVAIGVPVSASAQTLPRVPIVNAQNLIKSPDGAFVLHTIEQARIQLALARLAISETSTSDTRDLALQARELWTSVDDRLLEIANELGIPTPAEQDARERAKLYRLQKIKAQGFDSAYERVVARGCEALLQRMGRMDPQVNSQCQLHGSQHLRCSPAAPRHRCCERCPHDAGCVPQADLRLHWLSH